MELKNRKKKRHPGIQHIKRIMNYDTDELCTQ